MPQLTIQQRYAQLDQAARRRWRRDYMPPAKAQDARDLTLAIDQSNTGHGWPAFRDALLRRAIATWGSEYTLHPAQLEELDKYLETGEAFPLWAQAPGAADGEARRAALAAAPGPRSADSPEPKLDPSEPGRYVRPSGRFAQPGDPEFSADPRRG